MTKKQSIYAWDATVLLAWLNEEATAPLGNIDSVVVEIDQRAATLIVSVVAHTEVLGARHTDEQIQRFRDFLRRSNVVVADVDLRISEKAEGIRSKGLAKRPKIKTPDAQHMATAIIYGADVFHTLDDKLLKLNGTDFVDGLVISKPISISGQGMLD